MFKPRSRPNKTRVRRESDTGSDVDTPHADAPAAIQLDHKRRKGVLDQAPRAEPTLTKAVDVPATNSNILTGDDAFRTSEIDADLTADARAQYERVRDIHKRIDTGELEEGVYRGLKAYRAYITPDDERKAANAKFTGAYGQNRAMANVRTTSRFDFQADVCKDYKETGYCGFGDSCKFLHDRSDYKTGWELEREFNEQEKKAERERLELIGRRMAKQGSGEEEEAAEVDEKGKCAACEKEWEACATPACVTLCGHYFCESCFLSKSSVTCSACGKATSGIFNAI